MDILKHIFKKLDPTITKGATYRRHGEVEISFKYKPEEKVLLVRVIQARHMEPKDLRGKTANAYFKVRSH